MTRFQRSPAGRVFTSLVIYMFTFTSVFGQEYMWQIERLDSGDDASVQVGFAHRDLAFAWLDISPMFFPVKITALDVLYGSESGSIHTVFTNGYFFDNLSDPRYMIEGMTRSDGWNRSRFAVECTPCEIIFSEGPIAYGEQFLGEYIDPEDIGIIEPLRQDSSHIATASDGCWPSVNWVLDYATEEWIDVCPELEPGFEGNLTFRPHFVLLCPQRLGDIDGDEIIDYDDFYIFTDYMGGPDVDQWEGAGRWVDHDNDYDVDIADYAIFQNNFTADTNVGCPVFPMPETAGPISPSGGTSYPLFPTDWVRGGGTADTGFRPYASFGLGGGIQPDSTRQGRAWTYGGVAITVGIGLVILSLIWGPYISPSLVAWRAGRFWQDSENLDPYEEQRVKDAYDLLGEWEGYHEEIHDVYFRMDGLWNEPAGNDNPRINRIWSEDETGPMAVQINFDDVAIHHSWIDGDHWDKAIEYCEDSNPPVPNPQDCGKMVLAKVLRGEGQHIIHPNWTERQCQIRLNAVMKQLKIYNVWPEGHLGDEFGHAAGGCVHVED